MIRAECRTLDNMRMVEFDATAWFERADAETIALLAKRDWVAPWVADALENQPRFADVHELLQYARDRLQRESLEDPNWPAFECRVSDTDALAWLDQNRPEIAKSIRRRGRED
jgi:hypothetical protein